MVKHGKRPMDAFGIEASGLFRKQVAEVAGANGKIVRVARAVESAFVENHRTTAAAGGGEVIAAPICGFRFCEFRCHGVVAFLDLCLGIQVGYTPPRCF